MFGREFGGLEKEPEDLAKKKKGHVLSEEIAEHVPTEGVAFGPLKSTGGIESLLINEKKRESAE